MNEKWEKYQDSMYEPMMHGDQDKSAQLESADLFMQPGRFAPNPHFLTIPTPTERIFRPLSSPF
jgi:hypothetical protein